MAGGHFKRPWNFVGQEFGYIPKIRRSVGGQFVRVIEDGSPSESSNNSQSPLLVPKPVTETVPGEKAVDRIVPSIVLQLGGSKEKPETSEGIDYIQPSTRDKEEQNEQGTLTLSPEQDRIQQELVDKAFSKPIKVASLELPGKRKADSTSDKSKKKLKTYKLNVV